MKSSKSKGKEGAPASSDPNQLDLEQMIEQVEKEKKSTEKNRKKPTRFE